MSEETLFIIIIAWLLLFSAVLFALFGADKRRAKAGAFRIPERTLFLLALFGGALGGVIGMRAFRHKTKHASFVIGMPLLLVANLGAAWLLMRFAR